MPRRLRPEPEPDVVDEIALAWARERPGLPTSSIGVVTRIWHAAKLFGDDRRRVLAGAGADTAILDLLGVLRRSGSPYTLTTRELVHRTLVTPGAISQRIARAEREGLVVRATVRGSRAVEVTLTDAGHRAVDRLVDLVLSREVELLGILDGEEQATLTRLLRKLIAGVQNEVGISRPTHVGGH
jgi:DNA-binding MarR family transcriptional regulator